MPNCTISSIGVYDPSAWSCGFSLYDPVAPYPLSALQRCCGNEAVRQYQGCEQIQYCAAYTPTEVSSQQEALDKFGACIEAAPALPSGLTFCDAPQRDPFSTDCTSDGRGVPILPANVTHRGCGVNPNRPNPNLRKCCGAARIIRYDSCTT